MKHGDKTPVRLDVSSGTFIRFFSFLFLAYLIYLLRDIFLIVLTAIVIASAIEPINQWFKRHYIDRVYSVVIIYLTSAIILFGLIYLFIPSVVSQFQDLVVNIPIYIGDLQAPVTTEVTFLDSIRTSVPLDQVLGNLQLTTQTILSSPSGILSAVFGGLFSFLMIIILSFYLSVQDDGVANFLRIATPRRYEAYVIDLWGRTRKKIGAWLQGQLILSLIVAIFSFIGLTILGVPNALVLALLAGVFELIPLFGPILASIPAILIGVTSGGVKLGLFVAILYLIIQQLENHVFHPIVVKKVVGVPAIIVIISLLVGATLAGFLGIILAVPLAAGLMEFVNDIESYKGSDRDSLFEKLSLSDVMPGDKK